MIKEFFFLIIGVLFPILVIGQWRGIQLSTLGPKDGLYMTVNDFAESTEGFIYLGGTQGLIKYDGTEFQLYSHNPNDSTSISPGEVYNLAMDNDGDLWLSMRFGGLNKFDPASQEFSHYPLPKLAYYMIPTARGLLVDEEYGLWVGGHHFQLLLFDKETERYKSFQPEWIDPESYGKRLSINEIIQDKFDPNKLWFSVLDYEDPNDKQKGVGLVSFDKKSKLFTSHFNFGTLNIQDEDGLLFGTGTLGQIKQYDPSSKMLSIISLPTEKGLEIYPKSILLKKDQLLVTSAYGIYEINDSKSVKLLHLQSNKSSNYSNGLWRDRKGNIWIGKFQGVDIIDPQKQYFKFYDLEIFGDHHRIYPGRISYDWKNEMVYLSHTRGKIRKKIYAISLGEKDPDNSYIINTKSDIQGLAFDHNNDLIVAGDGSIGIMENPHDNSSHFIRKATNDSIPWLWNLEANQSGWIAGAGNSSFIWFREDDVKINSLHVDQLQKSEKGIKKDQFISGFAFGNKPNEAYLFTSVVHKINIDNGTFSELKIDPALNPNGQRLLDFIEDKDGNFWISGTDFFGKFILENDQLNLLKSFTISDGLASVEIHELFCDHQGRIWLFTTNGINAISPKTNELRYFGVNEGLPQTFIDPRQILESNDGSIITVNLNGLLVFHPDSLWNSSSPNLVPIVINTIRINGKKVNYAQSTEQLQEIKTPVGKFVIDIQFQGLEFPNADYLKYSYRLDSENDWIDIGSNKLVTLPELSPGTYQLEVKAGSPQSQAPVKILRIIVPKAFFQKWWFAAIIILLIGSGLYAWMRNRINRIKEKELSEINTNKRIAELELKALRSQMNPHFMFNSLNSIKDYILHAKKEKAAEYLSDFAHLIRLILQNSREHKISLAQELEAINLYIELEKLRFEDAFEYEYFIEKGLMLEHILIPPMLLQPFIENSIWHGLMHKKEKGKLEIRITSQNGHIQCCIDDNGIGRKKAGELKSLSATKYKSMGMGITKDRIDILNQINSLGIHIEIIDKTDKIGNAKGTLVVLSLPEEGSSH